MQGNNAIMDYKAFTAFCEDLDSDMDTITGVPSTKRKPWATENQWEEMKRGMHPKALAEWMLRLDPDSDTTRNSPLCQQVAAEQAAVSTMLTEVIASIGTKAK